MKYLKDQYVNICDGVWVWENFLSEEELKPIMKEIESVNWIECNYQNFNMKSFKKYEQRLLDSFNMENPNIPDLNNVILRNTGKGMEPHVDIYNYMNILYENEVPKSEGEVVKNTARLAMVIYFNEEYEGGEICYPEFDFSYKPKAGSVIVHDVSNIHGVKTVKSGMRYTHGSYVSDDYWVKKEIYDKIEFPTDPYSKNNDKYFYSAVDGVSTNKRLEEFRKKYVSDGSYGLYTKYK